MITYLISYGLGGGFGGASNHELLEAETESDASDYAYQLACEDYDTYVGTGGLRSHADIMEEDEIEDEEEADQIYNEERESWLDYRVQIYNEDKHADLLR